MIRHGVRYAIAAAVALLLAACSGQQVQLDIKARMEGQPATGATVIVDGKELGVTDGTGVFAKPITRSAGAEVEVLVSKELSGHRIKPWKTTFSVKLSKDGKVVDRYSFEADLAVTRYFTVAVNEGGTPVTDATVKLNDKELGKTDAKGELVHEYTTLPPKGVTLTVSKSGYAAWQKSASVQAGERLQVALARRAVLTVTASSDEYGVRAGVPGVAVSIDGRPLGKTDDRGTYTYTYDGAPGRKVQVTLSAPGYLPADWKTAVVLEGQVSVQRGFAPATPRPLRVGVHRFRSESAGHAVGARLPPRRLEDGRRSRGSGQCPARLRPGHAPAPPGRRAPLRGQHSRRGSQGRRLPGGIRRRGPPLQGLRVPRGAGRRPRERGQAAEGRHRQDRDQGLAGHAAAPHGRHDRARQRRPRRQRPHHRDQVLHGRRKPRLEPDRARTRRGGDQQRRPRGRRQRDGAVPLRGHGGRGGRRALPAQPRQTLPRRTRNGVRVACGGRGEGRLAPGAVPRSRPPASQPRGGRRRLGRARKHRQEPDGDSR